MVEWKGVMLGIAISFLTIIVLTIISWNMAMKRMNQELQRNPQLRKELVGQMKDALSRYEEQLNKEINQN